MKNLVKKKASGRNSKNKGRKYENELVDLFSNNNIKAERVPLSGALFAFNSKYGGDVILCDLNLYIEVKYRRNPEGFIKLLKIFEDNKYKPITINNTQGGTNYKLLLLDDFIIEQKTKTKIPANKQEIILPKLLLDWFNQGSKVALDAACTVLAVRLPKHIFKHQWFIIYA